MDKLQDCDDGLTFKQFVRMICMDPWKQYVPEEVTAALLTAALLTAALLTGALLSITAILHHSQSYFWSHILLSALIDNTVRVAQQETQS